METLLIKTKYQGAIALLESGYALKQASNFGYEHSLQDELKRWEKYSPIYYIIEADAKFNYGLDFEIYIRYWADGLQFIRPITFRGGSTLSSTPFRRAYIDEGVYFGVKQERYLSAGQVGYKKDREYRSILRQLCTNQSWILLCD